MSRQNDRTWVPEEVTIFHGTQRINKKALYLCINVFSTKVLIGTLFLRLLPGDGKDRHFTWSSEPREGLAICRAKALPSFLSYFHPPRPRGSQSGREKGWDESFQVRAKEPLGTDSHRTISKNSSGCRLPIGHKKCFVLLCPIGEQFLVSSFREFVHDGFCLDHGCTKEMHAVRKISV